MLVAGTAGANPGPAPAPGATPRPALDLAPSRAHTALASAQPGVQPYQPLPGHAIPPEPRTAGVGSVFLGWGMVHVGIGISATGLWAWAMDGAFDFSEPRVENRDVWTGMLIGGGVVAAIGLGIAVSGHSKLSESRRRQRLWQERYGQQGQAGRIDNPILAPMALRGGAGASLSFSF